MAVITLDNPPVNGLGHATRADVLAGIDRATEDARCDAIVITGADGRFSGGADIREFNTPQASAEPTLNTLIRAIDDCPKPVIAAVDGICMGGGLELALGCHYRVAGSKATLAMPEVKLGLLPGAGGTQRLPRAVGVEKALNLIVTGTSAPAATLKDTALFDAVIDGNVLDAALAFARDVVAGGCGRKRLRDVAIDYPNADALFQFARNAIAAVSKHFPAPRKCIDAVAGAVAMPFDDGLRNERRLFLELMQTPESRALRHMFLAERAATRIAGVADTTPVRRIERVAVVGAGTMGSGIAINFLNAGLPVTLVETSTAALDRGVGNIRRIYEAGARKGRLTPSQVDERLQLLTPTIDIGSVATADLVIEAAFESLDVKLGIFARLDGLVRPDTVLASNTSFLDLDAIAAATANPERVVGLHFFSPANVMRLLEVVRGTRTAEPVVATAMALAKRIGKVPVLSRTCPGFIANRLLAPRGAQADALALEGTPITAIDRVLFDYGFAMGHFQMMDLVGLDVVGREGNERTAMGDLVAAGRLGQKQNGGYYDYDAARRPTPSPLADRIIGDVARARGIAQAPTLGADALLARLLYPVVNEGARILEEGIALRASDIDVAAVLGYNWPVYTGGPMFWADAVGLDRVVAGLRELEASHGAAFRPADLLVDRAARGARFQP